MKSMLKIFVIIVCLSSNLHAQQIGCSAFVLNKGKIFLGKNLDWALGNGLILFNPRGEIKKSITSEGPAEEWTSKYCSITFNHFGKNLPLGGMNERGLVMEELSTWPSEYPYDEKLPSLNELEWIQYNLDTYSSVEEVITKAEDVNISKFAFRLHYILSDSTGNTAVIEFIDGKTKIYSGESLPYPVLSNNNYKELLKYIYSLKKSGRINLKAAASQDRFVTLVNLLSHDVNGESIDEQHAMSFLEAVWVSDTRWSVVYEITCKEIYYGTDKSTKTKQINFSGFNFNDEKSYYLSVNADKNIRFIEMATTDNDKYLKELRNCYSDLSGEESAYIANKISSLIGERK